MTDLEQAFETIRKAGKGVVIQVIDLSRKEFSKEDICIRFGRSLKWLKELIKEDDCLLEIKKQGGRGRNNGTKYFAHSVLKEEERLKLLNRI